MICDVNKVKLSADRMTLEVNFVPLTIKETTFNKVRATSSTQCLHPDDIQIVDYDSSRLLHCM
jgi:hypothetical protein